jgi:hypothetical protein
MRQAEKIEGLPPPEGASALRSRRSVPSLAFALPERRGSRWVPNGLTSRRGRIRGLRRAAALHPVPRGVRRFRPSCPPAALGACDVASWP